MTYRFAALAGATLAIAAAVSLIGGPASGQTGRPTPGLASAAQRAPVRNWTAERTPWGDPDISGIYSNSDESGIPFERPARFEGRLLQDITPAELDELRRERRSATMRSVADPEAPVDRANFWENLNATNSRAWLIVDPPDGKVPPMTPQAQKRVAARRASGRTSDDDRTDSAADRSLYDRCISRGLPGSMMPAIYGSSYEIVQGPNHVAILYEMIHEARVIPLDGRGRPSTAIKSYMGTPVGRWDGNTLVVETTNFKDDIAYRNANGDTLRLVERFTPVDAGTLEWSVTVDDPETWSRAWTFAMNLTRKDAAQRPFEYACHEGNYAMRNILSAARAAEKAAADAAGKGRDATR